jgi:hypothetical protein
VFLLVDQPSDLETAIFKLCLCVLSNSHSQSKWSVVWSFLPHGHAGEVISLKWYKYDFVAVTRQHGGKVFVCRNFHVQSFGNYREVFFGSVALSSAVPDTLPLLHTLYVYLF